MKNLLKQKAIQLRTQGKSYLEIQKEIHVAKSTLSFWLKDLILSNEVKEKISRRGKQISIQALIKRNKKQTLIARQKASDIRSRFSKEILKIEKSELFLLGLGLYLGEGYKRGAEGSKWKCVDIANSDPDIIQIMMRFFRECCDVKETDFRLYLSLHDQEKETFVRDFWIQKTGLNKANFIKTSFVISSSSKKKVSKKLEYGTLHIRIYNTDLFHKIIGWIDGIRKVV
jgi:hypothetical protein